MNNRSQRKFIRKVRPRVVVALSSATQLMMQTIVSLAREWNWDLLDYDLVYGEFPDDPTPSGALIDALGDSPLAQQLRMEGCQIVRLGRLPNPFDRLLPAVLPDMAEAGRLAARHFIERSFEHLAIIGWNADDPTCDRYQCYRSYCALAAKHGASTHVYNMFNAHRRDESAAEKFERRKRQVGAWLKRLPKPLGVLTYADTMAAQLCVMCQRIGLIVPEEVAILGMGNSTWCERSLVGLSSVMLNEAGLASQAMLLLRDLMAGASGPVEPIMVPPEGIKLRRSTDVVALEDLLVSKAFGFICEHFQEDIGVLDVAEAVGLSSRQLERRCQKAVGRSVNQEIVRRRLERVQRLLRTSAATVADIAPLTGFRSTRHLHYTFHRAVGMTPLQYRQSTHP